MEDLDDKTFHNKILKFNLSVLHASAIPNTL